MNLRASPEQNINGTKKQAALVRPTPPAEDHKEAANMGTSVNGVADIAASTAGVLFSG
jgi:hypothetical protein